MNEKSELYVLKYEKVYDELNVFITSGFSNPESGLSQNKIENGNSTGYGYELRYKIYFLNSFKSTNSSMWKYFKAILNFKNNGGKK